MQALTTMAGETLHNSKNCVRMVDMMKINFGSLNKFIHFVLDKEKKQDIKDVTQTM